MRPNWYTDLFFLDEVTALAAGHRPCAECQRARFNSFRELWAAANPTLAGSSRPLATAIDRQLQIERTGRRSVCRSINDLPDGSFVSDNCRDAYLVLKKHLLLWTPGGYTRPADKVAFPVSVLTPPSVVNALKAGYLGGIHSSGDAPGLSLGPV
jgi:hypothetical protein